MERLIIILTISILAGISFSLLVLALLQSLARLEIEKKFKERSEKITDVYKKGIVWNLLFIAGKIGESVKKIQLKKLQEIINVIAVQLEILGGQYKNVNPYTYVGVQIIFSLIFIIVSVLILDIYNVILLLIIAAMGFYVPLMWIKDQVKAKQKGIFRQIPDVLDMLTLMVEAGLDFNASLNKILELEKGHLIDEYVKAQQEIKLGKSRVEAYDAMAQRLHYQPLTQVLNAINLAIKTGGSLAPTLRTLSEQFRVERAQAAEKLANEAPIKLMLPLVALIFPTIFIILFGPIILSFMGKGF